MRSHGAIAIAITCIGLAACRCEGPDTSAPPAPPPAPAEARSIGGVPLPSSLPEDLRRALARPGADPDATGRLLATSPAVSSEFLEALAESPSLDDALVALRAFHHLGSAYPLRPDLLAKLLGHSADAISGEAITLATTRGEVELLLPLVEARSGVATRLQLLGAQGLSGWSSPAIDTALLDCARAHPVPDLAETCAMQLGSPGRPIDLGPWLREGELTVPKAIALEARIELIDASLRERLEALVADDKGPPSELTIRAARLLYFASPLRDLAALDLSLATSPWPDMRRIAAEFSSEFDAVDALRQDPDPAVRAAAVAGLGRVMREADRALALGAALDSEDATTRAAAIAAISATVPLAEATRLLSSRLAAAPPAEQSRIAQGLRAIPDRQAVDALITSLGDAKAGRAAYFALGYLAGEQPGEGEDPIAFFTRWRDTRFGLTR